MPPHDVLLLQEKLESLKDSFDSYKLMHDKRSDERWADLMEQFHEMKAEFKGRPCVLHQTMLVEASVKTLHNEKSIEKLTAKFWAIIILIVGAVVSAVAGLFKHN